MTMNPVVHFEMPYDDSKRLSDFYSQAFGWQLKQLGPEMGNYVIATTTETDEQRMIKKPGAINGGFAQKSATNQHPSVVISVDNIQESMQKVAEAGGTVLGEPQDIPGVGRYVSFTDTEGNNVSMLQSQNM